MKKVIFFILAVQTISFHSIWSAAQQESISDYLRRVALTPYRAIAGHNQKLIQAAQEEDINQVKELLALAGINLNAKNEQGTTALMSAVDTGNDEIVRLLLAAGADVNMRNNLNNTALILAVIKGNENVVKQLLVAGADANVHNSAGNTPLFLASAEGHDGVVNLLIGAGANSNACGAKGETALMWAAYKGYSAIMKQLLAAGAKINAQNKEGTTALMLAATVGKKKALKTLLAAGADFSFENYNGKTAYEFAISMNHLLIARMIQEEAHHRRMSAFQFAAEQAAQEKHLGAPAGVGHLPQDIIKAIGAIAKEQALGRKKGALALSAAGAKVPSYEEGSTISQLVKQAMQQKSMQEEKVRLSRARAGEAAIRRAEKFDQLVQILEASNYDETIAYALYMELHQPDIQTDSNEVRDRLRELRLRAMCERTQELGITRIIRASEGGKEEAKD